jgi:Tfp pilus assembly protein PilV
MTPKVRALRIGQAQCGLSLVEGLVAAALVAVAFLVISNLFPTGYSNITYGGNQTLAASYAQQKIEQLKSLSFGSIDATACANVCENLGSGFCRYCALTLTVGAGSLAGDLKKVQITVTWPGQFRPGSLSVDTIFTR